MTVALSLGAVSNVVHAMPAAVAKFLQRSKPTKVSVNLLDGTEIKFDDAMSPQEVTQMLGSISAGVRNTLQALPKQLE